MGVDRNVRSEATEYYMQQNRLVNDGISLLGEASEKASKLNKETLGKLGDFAAEVVAYAPGYAGRLCLVSARLFWTLAGAEASREGKRKVVSLDNLEKRLKELKRAVS